MSPSPPPHYHGHRKRLRERFVKNGLAGFAEHEALKYAKHQQERDCLLYSVPILSRMARMATVKTTLGIHDELLARAKMQELAESGRGDPLAVLLRIP